MQRAGGNVEQPGGSRLGIHLALEQSLIGHRKPVCHRRTTSTRTPVPEACRRPFHDRLGRLWAVTVRPQGVNRGRHGSTTQRNHRRSQGVSGTYGDLWISGWDESACKPGSVTRAGAHADGHPSGTTVAGGLVRSTRRHRTGSPPAQGPRRTPSRPCSGWGLPSRPGHPGRWCALTAPFHPYCRLARRRCGSGLFSVALSRGSPRVGVTDHPALWSPDFPRPPKVPRPSGQLVPRRKATPPCGTASAAA